MLGAYLNTSRFNEIRDFLRYEGKTMTILGIAVLAFVAGFLTCAATVIAIILWSYSDRRVSEIHPDQPKHKAAA